MEICVVKSHIKGVVNEVLPVVSTPGVQFG